MKTQPILQCSAQQPDPHCSILRSSAARFKRLYKVLTFRNDHVHHPVITIKYLKMRRQ